MCGEWGGWLGLEMIQVVSHISLQIDLLEVTGNSIKRKDVHVLCISYELHKPEYRGCVWGRLLQCRPSKETILVFPFSHEKTPSGD